ncbi:uncharacterized protein LOC126748306 isoform X2 [Anthonomus grandis grandis]|uniref:uncharacterized protein LOC126748306 isoform X2 n=1 Tax=Anthonomus grandis grandis TaxID=2921223 RepID=UPI002164FD1A|nr:uncharacterized protein LOC126748306 isoform X2 [Anthonomus grandis grandis]
MHNVRKTARKPEDMKLPPDLLDYTFEEFLPFYKVSVNNVNICHQYLEVNLVKKYDAAKEFKIPHITDFTPMMNILQSLINQKECVPKSNTLAAKTSNRPATKVEVLFQSKLVAPQKAYHPQPNQKVAERQPLQPFGIKKVMFRQQQNEERALSSATNGGAYAKNFPKKRIKSSDCRIEYSNPSAKTKPIENNSIATQANLSKQTIVPDTEEETNKQACDISTLKFHPKESNKTPMLPQESFPDCDADNWLDVIEEPKPKPVSKPSNVRRSIQRKDKHDKRITYKQLQMQCKGAKQVEPLINWVDPDKKIKRCKRVQDIPQNFKQEHQHEWTSNFKEVPQFQFTKYKQEENIFMQPKPKRNSHKKRRQERPIAASEVIVNEQQTQRTSATQKAWSITNTKPKDENMNQPKDTEDLSFDDAMEDLKRRFKNQLQFHTASKQIEIQPVLFRNENKTLSCPPPPQKVPPRKHVDQRVNSPEPEEKPAEQETYRVPQQNNCRYAVPPREPKPRAICPPELAGYLNQISDSYLDDTVTITMSPYKPVPRRVKPKEPEKVEPPVEIEEPKPIQERRPDCIEFDPIDIYKREMALRPPPPPGYPMPFDMEFMRPLSRSTPKRQEERGDSPYMCVPPELSGLRRPAEPHQPQVPFGRDAPRTINPQGLEEFSRSKEQTIQEPGQGPQRHAKQLRVPVYQKARSRGCSQSRSNVNLPVVAEEVEKQDDNYKQGRGFNLMEYTRNHCKKACTETSSELEARISDEDFSISSLESAEVNPNRQAGIATLRAMGILNQTGNINENCQILFKGSVFSPRE